MTNHQKYALVTGGTGGIGYELAKLLAQDHYNLVLVARSQEDLDQRASEFRQQYGIDVFPLAKDLFQPQAPFEVYQVVQDKGIGVEILVNNAGQGQYGQFIETDLSRELDIIQLNIVAYPARKSRPRVREADMQCHLIRENATFPGSGGCATRCPVCGLLYKG